jgi:hypothetical protein
VNRRQSLGTSAAIAAAGAIPAFAQPEPAEAKLPPSIASLSSMHDQVRPITADERSIRR